MVILIVGKTCSGKDTVARRIEEVYDFHRIITYTTRPMRPDDIQGVSHHFLTQEERSRYKDEDLFSPTEIAGYEYFMTKSQFAEGDAVCIVDPKGVEDFKALGVQCFTIYVDCPEDLILARAKSRHTDIGVVSSRLKAERERFEEFRESGNYTFRIHNTETANMLKAKTDICMVRLALQPGMKAYREKLENILKSAKEL